MDIFFTDPTEIPLPPDEVRIRSLRAEAWPDGRRVRVSLEVDPTLKRPNADLLIQDAQGNEVAAASIIESMDRRMEITMHLRGFEGGGPYKLSATLFFAELEKEPAPGQEPALPERLVTDTAQVTFEVGEGPKATDD